MQKFPTLVSLLLSAVALVMLVVNLSLTVANRSKQGALVQRQQTVTANQPLIQFDQNLGKLIDDASIKYSDPQLHALMTVEGVQPPAGGPVQQAN